MFWAKKHVFWIIIALKCTKYYINYTIKKDTPDTKTFWSYEVPGQVLGSKFLLKTKNGKKHSTLTESYP